MTAIPAIPWQLGPDQLRELADARAAGRSIRRAVIFANIDAAALFAASAISLLIGLLSPTSFIVGLALAVIASLEMRGASQLKRLDESAPRRLAWNQLALGTFLALYSIWRIYHGLHGPTGYEEITQLDPRLGQSIEDMSRSFTVATYACLILVAIFAQGGAALYYFTRAKHIRSYLRQTPGWILQMQQSGFAV
jgi:hypothetical protein